MPHHRRLAAALAFGFLTTWSAPTLAGGKIDFSPYIGGVPDVGDFKVYDTNAGWQRVVTAQEVSAFAKGWRIVSQSDVTGNIQATSLVESFAIPGKQLFSGRENIDLGSVAFSILPKKPAKGLRLTGSLGKPQRLTKQGALFVNGSLAGTASRLGFWTAQGFESVDTPATSYATALRASVQEGLTFFDGSTELAWTWNETFWYVAGLGTVRGDVNSAYYENGVQMSTSTWEEWFASGVIGGVPVSASSTTGAALTATTRFVSRQSSEIGDEIAISTGGW